MAELSNASTTGRMQTTLSSSGNNGLLWLIVLVAVGMAGLVVVARVVGWRVRFRRSVAAFAPGAGHVALRSDNEIYRPIPRATVRTLGGPQVP